MKHIVMIRRLSAALGLAAVVAILLATISPIELRPELTHGYPDIERFLAYAMMSGCLAIAFPRQRWLVLALTIMVAMTLEATQLLTESRHGRPYDAFVKMGGACIGVLGAMIAETALGTLALTRWKRAP